MPRYRFTHDDLGPLRRFIDRPDVQRLLARVIPVKRFDARPPTRVEELEEPLPFKLRSRRNPEGVPLAALAKLVRERVPEARSLMVRDGRVLVCYGAPPTPEMRAALRRLVRDGDAMQPLIDRARPRPGEPTRSELRAKLVDPQLSDADWLHHFRLLTTAKLREEG